MAVSTSGCDSADCDQHFHAQDPVFAPRRQSAAGLLAEQRSSSSEEGQTSAKGSAAVVEANPSSAAAEHGFEERGFRRIIRNFTPS